MPWHHRCGDVDLRLLVYWSSVSGTMQTYPEFCRAQLEAGSNRLNFAIADLEAAHGQVMPTILSFPDSTTLADENLQMLILTVQSLLPLSRSLNAVLYSASWEASRLALCMDDQARLWGAAG